MESETARKALDYGARVLAPRMLSVKALRDKMAEREFDEEDIDFAIERLVEFGALNDEEYAASVARYYANRGFGKQKVAQELHRRGVPREIAMETIEDFEPCSEKVIAYLEKTIKDNYEDKRLIRKAASGLYRRGFTWEQINAAIDVYCDTEENY